MSPDSLVRFIEARNAALRTLDLNWARRTVPYVNDETLLVTLHKTRYDCTMIEDHLRLESAEWLRARGYKALGGVPLLPPGELPRGV
jgi:hypothetical protein